MTEFTHVPGKEKGDIKLYSLSTCGWCKRLKKHLNDLGVAYDYIDCDLVEGKEGDDLVKEVMKWNPKETYPTMVLNGEKAFLGFDLDEIAKALK